MSPKKCTPKRAASHEFLKYGLPDLGMEFGERFSLGDLREAQDAAKKQKKSIHFSHLS